MKKILNYVSPQQNIEVFLVDRGSFGRSKKKTENIQQLVQQLKTKLGEEIVKNITLIHTNFPDFSGERICEEHRQKIKKQLKDILPSTLPIIHVSNPPRDRESRQVSRQVLLNYLEPQQEEQKPILDYEQDK
jgi:hypothetical protein